MSKPFGLASILGTGGIKNNKNLHTLNLLYVDILQTLKALW